MRTSIFYFKRALLTMAVVLSPTAYAETAQTCDTEIQTVCFTPGSKCEYLITQAIDSATESLSIQAYHITNREIIKHVIAVKQRGIDVRIIVDKTAKREIQAFLNSHIPVFIDYKPHIAHNKVMIIDGKTVVTGSFNFTQNALKNAENVLIFSDKVIAEKYTNNFNYRLTLSKKIL